MATLELSDGRVIPIVKPHLGDQMDFERQMRATRPKYGPADFQEDMKLASVGTAFALFASLNRAGVKTTVDEVFQMDLENLSRVLRQEAGDVPATEDEGEGEQSADPTPAETAAPAVPETETTSGPSATV